MGFQTRTIPDATALPLMPPVRAAEEAVHAILHRELITGDEARKRVRVEITRDVEREIRRSISAANYHLFHDPRATIGPMQIMGISYYVVDNLPEPGWRVLP